MKKLAVLASLLVLVSFRAEALPPPPQLPKAIASMPAKISIVLNVSDKNKCNTGMFCEQVTETCSFSAKIPVIAANNSDEFYVTKSLIADNGKKVECMKDYVGLNHLVRANFYVTVDRSQNLMKLVKSTDTGKSKLADFTDLSAENSYRDVAIFSSTSPSFKLKSYHVNQVNSHETVAKVKSILTDTQQDISVSIEFDSLVLEKP